MQLAGSAAIPPVRAPDKLVLSPWGEADPARFFAVYDAAFRDRPGFPGWPLERWVEWISDDDDFRPEWTLLAALGGVDVGFIVGDGSGWIAQMGVIPSARGARIGAVLIGEAVRRMRSGGQTHHHAERQRRQPARDRALPQARLHPHGPPGQIREVAAHGRHSRQRSMIHQFARWPMTNSIGAGPSAGQRPDGGAARACQRRGEPGGVEVRAAAADRPQRGRRPGERVGREAPSAPGPASRRQSASGRDEAPRHRAPPRSRRRWGTRRSRSSRLRRRWSRPGAGA